MPTAQPVGTMDQAGWPTNMGHACRSEAARLLVKAFQQHQVDIEPHSKDVWRKVWMVPDLAVTAAGFAPVSSRCDCVTETNTTGISSGRLIV